MNGHKVVRTDIACEGRPPGVLVFDIDCARAGARAAREQRASRGAREQNSRYDTENHHIPPRGRLTPEYAEDLRPGDRIIPPDPDGHNLYGGAPMVIVHAIGSLGDDRTIIMYVDMYTEYGLPEGTYPALVVDSTSIIMREHPHV